MAVILSKGIVVPPTGVPVGTTWLYETTDTFIVPADGNYQIELHGGGGGGGGGFYFSYGVTNLVQYGGGGGGSGNLLTLSLLKGDSYPIVIGAGGAAGSKNANYQLTQSGTKGGTGGTTSFGGYSVAGGTGGNCGEYAGAFSSTQAAAGTASGSIATAGSDYTGGYGNKNNTSQAYGNGGAGGEGWADGSAGKAGAVIITYLGVA